MSDIKEQKKYKDSSFLNSSWIKLFGIIGVLFAAVLLMYLIRDTIAISHRQTVANCLTRTIGEEGKVATVPDLKIAMSACGHFEESSPYHDGFSDFNDENVWGIPFTVNHYIGIDIPSYSPPNRQAKVIWHQYNAPNSRDFLP